MNEIVHPAVSHDSNLWFKSIQSNSPYCLKEAALIFETKGEIFLDKVIVVTAPLNKRLERVMMRDKISKQNIIDRMNKQISQEEKNSRADILINNDGQESIIEQVLKIHHSLINKSS